MTWGGMVEGGGGVVVLGSVGIHGEMFGYVRIKCDGFGTVGVDAAVLIIGILWWNFRRVGIFVMKMLGALVSPCSRLVFIVVRYQGLAQTDGNVGGGGSVGSCFHWGGGKVEEENQDGYLWWEEKDIVT